MSVTENEIISTQAVVEQAEHHLREHTDPCADPQSRKPHQQLGNDTEWLWPRGCFCLPWASPTSR
jgi:hypothetical protein